MSIDSFYFPIAVVFSVRILSEIAQRVLRLDWGINLRHGLANLDEEIPAPMREGREL
jgi:hypothetical protein